MPFGSIQNYKNMNRTKPQKYISNCKKNNLMNMNTIHRSSGLYNSMVSKSIRSLSTNGYSNSRSNGNTAPNSSFTDKLSSNLSESLNAQPHIDENKEDEIIDSKDPKDHPSLRIINFSKNNEPENSNLKLGPMNTIQEYNPEKKRIKLSQKEIEQRFAYYFLPNDYPQSVNPGYLKFSMLISLSAVSITLMSFISTQALFVALGSTTTNASLYSAAYTWVLKDGIGQLGGIIFAGKYGKSFDQDVKKWRFLAMLAMNVAIIIEMVTLKFPGAFIYLASLANIGKNVTFLCASATRANINLRFARRNNIGDIASKAVTQFTASSLTGIGIGLIISKAFNIASFNTIFPLFSFLTMTNVICSYYSTMIVDEYYFNKERFHILYNEYIQKNTILDVQSVGGKEQFYLPSFLNDNIEHVIKVGEFSLVDQINYCKTQGRNDTADILIRQSQDTDKNFTYYIHWTKTKKNIFPFTRSKSREYYINLNIGLNATNEQILKAYFFALMLHEKLEKKLDKQLPAQVRKTFARIDDKYHKTRTE